jgi:hypothetical protein
MQLVSHTKKETIHDIVNSWKFIKKFPTIIGQNPKGGPEHG